MHKAREKFAIMKMFEIKKVVKEFEANKTFYLKEFIDCKPGQFVMVWLPGIDEKPFSLMSTQNKSAINMEVKGEWSKEFFKKKEKDKIGLRGPFGNGFDWLGIKKACVVAGGVGAAPLLPLSFELKKTGAKTKFILGAQTKSKLLFEKELKQNVQELIVTTDDGSAGKKGVVADVLSELLEKESFDCVFTCGPEKMMQKVFGLCRKERVEIQASLERFMKCGFGVCGACMANDRIVCVDGPVFGSTDLEKMSEFGNLAHLKSGKKCNLNEFYGWRTT